MHFSHMAYSTCHAIISTQLSWFQLLRGSSESRRRKLIARRHHDCLNLGCCFASPPTIRAMEQVPNCVRCHQGRPGPCHFDLAIRADWWLQLIKRSSDPVDQALTPVVTRLNNDISSGLGKFKSILGATQPKLSGACAPLDTRVLSAVRESRERPCCPPVEFASLLGRYSSFAKGIDRQRQHEDPALPR